MFTLIQHLLDNWFSQDSLLNMLADSKEPSEQSAYTLSARSQSPSSISHVQSSLTCGTPVPRTVRIASVVETPCHAVETTSTQRYASPADRHLAVRRCGNGKHQ